MSDLGLITAHQWGDVHRAAANALMKQAIAAAREAGAQFCDVRLSETEEMRLYAVSGVAADERLEGHAGIGVRVLVDGVWGFASRPLRDGDDGRDVALAAVANARAAQVGSPRRVELPARPAEVGFYQTDAAVDPFTVGAAERETLVMDALRSAGAERGVVRVQAGVNAKRQHRFFANSEGSLQEQHFVESGAMPSSF